MSHHFAAEAAAATAGVMTGDPTRRQAPRELSPEEVERRQAAADRLARMDPVGKRIHFQDGISRQTVRVYARGPGIPFTVNHETDLAGISGTVMDTEVGTVLGERVVDPGEIIFHVYKKGAFFPPKLPHNYVVRESEANFVLA